MASRGTAVALLAAGVAVGTVACDVAWGGASLELRDLSPPREEPEETEPEEAEPARALPLPEGPLLYAARVEPGGRARVVPVARLPRGGGAPLPLELPAALDSAYRARFDAAFLAPGTELALQRWGRRIGTLVVEGPAGPAGGAAGVAGGPAADCPSVATATAFLLPGQPPPSLAPAVPAALAPPMPERAPPPEVTRGMTLASPVLAERLIADERAYLARRVALEAVLLSGDSTAMAVTYLVEDSLAPGPPGDRAISLFFLALDESPRGFTPLWSEVRRYDDAAAKETFLYAEWARVPGGRLHLLRRVGGEDVRLAAAWVPEEATEEVAAVAWTEGGACGALALLEGSP